MSITEVVSLSVEPTVSERTRGLALGRIGCFSWWNVLVGEVDAEVVLEGAGIVCCCPCILMGDDDANDLDTCGMSTTGCREEALDCCDRFDDPLAVGAFLLSLAPAVKDNKSGDDGWDTRAEEERWLEGDTGRFPPFLDEVDRALPRGLLEAMGLASSGDEGFEVARAGVDFNASVFNFWMTSLFAFSKTGKFLKAKFPKSS